MFKLNHFVSLVFSICREGGRCLCFTVKVHLPQTSHHLPADALHFLSVDKAVYYLPSVKSLEQTAFQRKQSFHEANIEVTEIRAFA